MALLGNYQLNLRSPGFWHSANSYRCAWNTPGGNRAIYGHIQKHNSVPAGGTGWVLAQIGGGLATYTTLEGLIVASGVLAAGINIEASLSGFNSTVNADLQVIANLAATIACDLTTVDAQLASVAAATATIACSGSIAADLGAIVGLSANIAASGAITTNIVALFQLEAEISSQTELSPQNLAESLWNSVAADYNAAGTMGEKLNDAGSASNPWTEVIEDTLTAAAILRILLSVQAGETTITDLGGGNATVKFKSVAGTDRVVASVSGSERTSVTVDPF